MPDITVCINFTCKERKTCYRYLATWNQWQSAFYFNPKDNSCDYYSQVFPGDEILTLDQADNRSITITPSKE